MYMVLRSTVPHGSGEAREGKEKELKIRCKEEWERLKPAQFHEICNMPSPVKVKNDHWERGQLTSLPMCGFIAQLVEHGTGIAEVTSSNPVEALIFFQASSFQLL